VARDARGVCGRRQDRLKPALERSGEITWELARREAKWLELAEALDRIDAPG
jgi:hypothetical protein